MRQLKSPLKKFAPRVFFLPPLSNHPSRDPETPPCCHRCTSARYASRLALGCFVCYGLAVFLEDIDVRYEFVRHLLYYPISILALGNLSPFLDLTRQHCTGEIPSRRSSVCKYARLFKTSLPGIARFKTNLYWTVYHHEEARQ